ncbi:putative ovule protein [Forsythia ovata]|uniref:Ovule protein n=1 Tax=Forsythia ovata TaxID=205694 RepID=A0ABD1PL48_9LAMI
MDNSNSPGQMDRQTNHLGVNMMGKNINKSPLHQPNFSGAAKQQPQPQVYNINKNDFCSIVQQLIGSPSQESLPRPPQNPTRPASNRLQRIRPLPLALMNRTRLTIHSPMPMPDACTSTPLQDIIVTTLQDLILLRPSMMPEITDSDFDSDPSMHDSNDRFAKQNVRAPVDLPPGNYEFIDVVLSDSKRYFIDMDFASEFVIARPSNLYQPLLQYLSRVYVGKREHLKQILKITSDAAKAIAEEQRHPPSAMVEAPFHAEQVARSVPTNG